MKTARELHDLFWRDLIAPSAHPGLPYLWADLGQAQQLAWERVARESARPLEFRFRWNGDDIRVIVSGDVLSLPDERWSMGGFGSSISVEWLLHEGRLPGQKARRDALAECLVRALDQARRGGFATGDGDTHPHGPCVPCSDCRGSGFVSVSR